MDQIIRRNEDGTVDDVAIDGNLLRLEQMDDDFWWLAIYRGDKRVAFHITTPGECGEGMPISVMVVEDDLGCIDDTTKEQPNDEA